MPLVCFSPYTSKDTGTEIHKMCHFKNMQEFGNINDMTNVVRQIATIIIRSIEMRQLN